MPDHDAKLQARNRRRVIRAFLIGAVVAVIPFFVSALAWVLHHFAILVHEFGHAAFAWAFGYPTIPSFDFVHGSGFAASMDRHSGLLWLLRVLVIAGTIAACKTRKLIRFVFAAAAIWFFLAETHWHQAVIAYMGHGTELLIAGIFLYRAGTGVALRLEAERIPYAAVGFWLAFENAVFAIRLLTDKTARYAYENDFRGIVNDFHDVAYTHLGNADLTVMAWFHLVMTILTIVLATFAIRHLTVNYGTTA